MTVYLIALGILLCLCGSAFFSASEMSYSACNRLRLENEAEDGSRKAGLALRILDRYDDALSAILIGNNLVNIASSSLGSVFVILVTGSDAYVWVATVVLTVLVIIFGETIPKITAKKNANGMAVRSASLLHGLMIVLSPLIWVVVHLIAWLTRGLKGDEEGDVDEAVEELQSIIETAEDEEVLDEDQTELVQAAIGFADISAQEVMTARVDVLAIDIDDDWEDILAVVENSPYSRLPVYEDNIDNVIGVLYLNHFLKALTESESVDIRSLLMPPCYVYKTMKLPEVMNQLRRAKQHLAIVTGEYGGIVGVLSMEDMLEQIVGEIWDETDTVEPEVTEHAGGIYELDGSMMMGDFLELFDIREDELEAESDTVGGWTLESFGGAYPKSGESFHWQGLRVTVLSMDGRRVEKVLVQAEKEDNEENK